MLFRALGSLGPSGYLDVGAQDPLQDSVSAVFYDHGWRGVHLEPSGTYASKLIAARPEEVVLPAALGATEGYTPLFEVPETGLSTLDPNIADHHRAQGRLVVERRVFMTTLDQVFRSYFPDGGCRWLKLDVEGWEEQALAGWNSSKVRPEIVVIEAVSPIDHSRNSEPSRKKLESLGYIFVYFDALNEFYVHQSSAQLADKFSLPPNLFDGFILSGESSSPLAMGMRSPETTVDIGLGDGSAFVSTLISEHRNHRESRATERRELLKTLFNLSL